MHCLIVEDHPITSLGLQILLQRHFPTWKIASATSVQEAFQYIHAANGPAIELMLLDIDLPDQSGIALLEHFHKTDLMPSFSIVVSALNDQKTIDLCKQYGANGCVPKRKAPNKIIQAIHVVRSGKTYFHTDEEETAHTPINESMASIQLSRRQKDLIDLVLAGYSNKRIAETLNLSYGTVKNYMFDLMRLLSVRSRMELLVKVRENGYESRVRSRSLREQEQCETEKALRE